MTLWNETKSVPVSKDQVWLAYKKVRSKAGSAGIDQISMEEYNANRSGHLYKLWNRMASGSYFPPPLKEEIPRKTGKLGVPNIAWHKWSKDYLKKVRAFHPILMVTTRKECSSGIGRGTEECQNFGLGN